MEDTNYKNCFDVRNRAIFFYQDSFYQCKVASDNKNYYLILDYSNLIFNALQGEFKTFDFDWCYFVRFCLGM